MAPYTIEGQAAQAAPQVAQQSNGGRPPFNGGGKPPQGPPPQGPFHKVGISFGNAGAIVRLTKDNKIMSVAASWVRTRKGNEDKVFITYPDALLGAPEERVRVVTLVGDAQKKRYDIILQPEEHIMNMMEGSTLDGYYGVIYMDRVGQSPDFRSMLYRIDSSWRLDSASATPIAKLASWLHEDFSDHARDIPGGGAILYAAATLFGGQDPEFMPPPPSDLPADLAEACTAERQFRLSQRRARALSPAQVEAFKAKLTESQVASFDALLAGRRSHV